MSRLIDIIKEEIMTTAANYPQFGDRLRSINEIGEASAKPYPFTFDHVSFNEVNYNFETEEDDYVVMINNVDPNAGVWMMQFGTVGGTPQDVVNRGRIFNVMATVLQITNDFLDRFKPNVLRFKPEKDESKPNDKRRFNIYMAYIKKHMRNDYFVYE